jgi:hypothetical protein
LLLCPFDVAQEIRLAIPEAETASDILCPDALDHSNVVIKIAMSIEDTFHRNGAGQIIFQNCPGNRLIKMIIAGWRDRRFGGDNSRRATYETGGETYRYQRIRAFDNFERAAFHELCFLNRQ